LDPVIEVQPARGQVQHLLAQIKERTAVGERVLVTTLTKRLAEDLSFYLGEQGVRCKWLHSELDAFERVDLLRDLRSGRFDALVGVNLLREGLDLPEVSLVTILDADKEGFLRSETSLMQTIGRAARHVNAKVILYADRVTDSMQRAIEETARRRRMQEDYNTRHGITPTSIKKAIRAGIEAQAEAHARANAAVGRTDETQYITEEYLAELEKEMFEEAEQLQFERAAKIRDRIEKMRDAIGKPVDDVDARRKDGSERGGGRRRGGARVPRPKRA
jgi:excinuclease ABC subunit B